MESWLRIKHWTSEVIGRFMYRNISLLRSSADLKLKLVYSDQTWHKMVTSNHKDVSIRWTDYQMLGLVFIYNMFCQHKHFGVRFFMVTRPLPLIHWVRGHSICGAINICKVLCCHVKADGIKWLRSWRWIL